MGLFLFWMLVTIIVLMDIQKYDVKPSVKVLWVVLTFLFGVFALIGYLIVSRNWKKVSESKVNQND